MTYWRTTQNGRPDQAFSGYNWLVTNEKRTVIGHNVGNADYDRLMDSEKVQELIAK